MADIRDSQLYCATRLFGAYGYNRGDDLLPFCTVFRACAHVAHME